MEDLWAKMGITAEHTQILVTSHQCDLRPLETCFEQAAHPLMAKIGEVQIDDAEILTCPREGCAGRAVIEREDSGVSVVS